VTVKLAWPPTRGTVPENEPPLRLIAVNLTVPDGTPVAGGNPLTVATTVAGCPKGTRLGPLMINDAELVLKLESPL
jgi:hypothetical protein